VNVKDVRLQRFRGRQAVPGGRLAAVVLEE